jgi:hypothetical protein
MSTDNPYPANGTLYRLEQADKRLDRIEAGAPGTITGDMQKDIADLRAEFREGIKEVKDELRYVKRAFWSMSGVFALLVTILLQIRPI